MSETRMLDDPRMVRERYDIPAHSVFYRDIADQVKELTESTRSKLTRRWLAQRAAAARRLSSTLSADRCSSRR
jgi:hypothetical protein